MYVLMCVCVCVHLRLAKRADALLWRLPDISRGGLCLVRMPEYGAPSGGVLKCCIGVRPRCSQYMEHVFVVPVWYNRGTVPL